MFKRTMSKTIRLAGPGVEEYYLCIAALKTRICLYMYLRLGDGSTVVCSRLFTLISVHQNMSASMQGRDL